MAPKHWALIAAFLGALAVQIGGIDHWADIRQPSFVAGILAQCAVFLGALFTAKPTQE
jgi:hypothetical protein